MRRIGLILIISFWIVLPLVQLSANPSQPARYDPVHHEPKHSGFVNFLLNRINPADIDYGEILEADRHVAIRTTLQSLYFSVAIVSSCAALLFFFWLLHASRVRERQEIIAARFLTWYHNELVRAQQAALDGASRHEQLRRFIDGERIHKPQAEAVSLSDLKTDAASKTNIGAPVFLQSSKPVAPPDIEADIVKNMQTQIVRLQRQLADERQKNRKLKGE